VVKLFLFLSALRKSKVNIFAFALTLDIREIMTFNIDCNGLWLSVTSKIFFFGLLYGILIAGLAVFFNGDNCTPFFEDISSLTNIYLYIGFALFCGLSAFLLIAFIRSSKVSIKNDELFGRNAYGFKNVIPLKHIDFIHTEKHFIEAIIVSAANYGEIYIHKRTQELDKLMEIIQSKMKSTTD